MWQMMLDPNSEVYLTEPNHVKYVANFEVVEIQEWAFVSVWRYAGTEIVFSAFRQSF